MTLRCRLLLPLATAFIPSFTQAADIYRWVDDQGRVHIADTVPDRYRGVATKLDSKSAEPSARQRTEAADRAAKDKARLAEFDAARQAKLPASSASATQLRATPRGAVNSGATECDRLWQEYHESQVCFGPYFLGQGGIRAEAFAKCKEVKNPSQQCGPSKYTSPQ
jgi:hypothetical protein